MRGAPAAQDIPDWDFYVAFSLFRLAAIVQGVYKRGLDGNASSETAKSYGDRARVLADLGWSLVRESCGPSTLTDVPRSSRCSMSALEARGPMSLFVGQRHHRRIVALGAVLAVDDGVGGVAELVDVVAVVLARRPGRRRRAASRRPAAS